MAFLAWTTEPVGDNDSGNISQLLSASPAQAMQSLDIGDFTFEWDNDSVYHYLFFYLVKANVDTSIGGCKRDFYTSSLLNLLSNNYTHVFLITWLI